MGVLVEGNNEVSGVTLVGSIISAVFVYVIAPIAKSFFLLILRKTGNSKEKRDKAVDATRELEIRAIRLEFELASCEEKHKNYIKRLTKINELAQKNDPFLKILLEDIILELSESESTS